MRRAIFSNKQIAFKQMKQQTLHLLRCLIIGLSTLCVGSCATGMASLLSTTPTEFDVHGVEAIFGTSKFNLASASNINRNSKQIVTTTQNLKMVNSGHAGDWQWRIYATPETSQLIKSFGSERTMTVSKGATSHKLNVPSLNEAMQEFYEFYRMILGTKLLPLNLQLAIYPQNVQVKIEKRLHNDSGIPMYFALSIPEKVQTDGGTAYDWIADTIGLVGHEYWHAYNRESKGAPFINMMTEEVTAYTLERCIRTALYNHQGTAHLIGIGGQPLDINNLETERKKIPISPVTVEPSLGAKTLSLYNMAWVLRTNVIGKNDVQLQNQLYGLCYAMVNDPVDMTKGFYPRDKVVPMPFNG